MPLPHARLVQASLQWVIQGFVQEHENKADAPVQGFSSIYSELTFDEAITITPSTSIASLDLGATAPADTAALITAINAKLIDNG